MHRADLEFVDDTVAVKPLAIPKVCLPGIFHGATGEIPTRILTKLSDPLNRCFWELVLSIYIC